MVSGAAIKALRRTQNFPEITVAGQRSRVHETRKVVETRVVPKPPFLRIPPFPGAQIGSFIEGAGIPTDAALLGERLRSERVGGAFWAAQPEVPAEGVIVRCRAALELAFALAPKSPVIFWSASGEPAPDCQQIATIADECDPWYVLSHARALIFEPGDELEIIASLIGIDCYAFEPADNVAYLVEGSARSAVQMLSRQSFINPFTGDEMDALETVELCGFWRKLIDSNREIVAAVGFAFWKQDHVAPLLWGGRDRLRFLRSAEGLGSGGSIAVWRAKTASSVVVGLEREGRVVEVEDGFLRSKGLGADCIPPLSITVDRLGEHFDPSRPSELELLLQEGQFEDELLERARCLRQVIVDAGIGKYEMGANELDRPGGDRRHVLVPGQVEDDRSVRLGGCGLVSNIDLLQRVRAREPNAYIVFKPHPDVLAGHRRGAVSDDVCLRFADEIISEPSIASLIDMVDEVHVNTSLAGFEALLRGKAVTTHGVPFYAGWGLTNDLGPVPERRSAKRTIDELIAATLLIYPRYIDPVSGLPCPAEIVVTQLSKTDESNPGFIVGVRRLQGRLKRRLRGLVQ